MRHGALTALRCLENLVSGKETLEFSPADGGTDCVCVWGGGGAARRARLPICAMTMLAPEGCAECVSRWVLEVGLGKERSGWVILRNHI